MFERKIEETVEIAANPAEVWFQLTNFEAYPEWNPFITRVTGELRVGARLTVTMAIDRMPPTVFRPRVLALEPERELRWRGRVGLPNVLDGEHTFLIETLGIDRVRFRQCETFGGLLAPGALMLTEAELRRSFREMNDRLRQRAEASYATRQVVKAERQARGQRMAPNGT